MITVKHVYDDIGTVAATAGGLLTGGEDTEGVSVVTKVLVLDEDLILTVIEVLLLLWQTWKQEVGIHGAGLLQLVSEEIWVRWKLCLFLHI